VSHRLARRFLDAPYNTDVVSDTFVIGGPLDGKLDDAGNVWTSSGSGPDWYVGLTGHDAVRASQDDGPVGGRICISSAAAQGAQICGMDFYSSLASGWPGNYSLNFLLYARLSNYTLGPEIQNSGNWLRAVVEFAVPPYGQVRVHKKIDNAITQLAAYSFVAPRSGPTNPAGERFVLSVDSDGNWALWYYDKNLPAVPTFIGQDDDLKAGNPLGSGKMAWGDHKIGPDHAIERRVDNVFQAPDQGYIIQQLIEKSKNTAGENALGIPDLGILTPGVVDNTVARRKIYQAGDNVGSALSELLQFFNGPELYLKPLDRTDGVMAELNVVKRRGTDKSAAVRFEYARDRHNCQDFIYEPDGTESTNRYTVLGQAEEAAIGPSYTSELISQQILAGIYEGFEGSLNTNEPSIVRAQAQQRVAAYGKPPDFFTAHGQMEGATEQFGTPPRVLVDYGIGDTVRGVAKLGAKDVDETGRVTGIRLVRADSAGNVRAEVTCVPTVQASPEVT
jgi:hypothetical protein